MDTLKQKIISKLKEKDLSDSSIKNYVRNLEILNDGKEFNNLNFLSKKEDINKKIDLKKGNTQRSYYIAIVSILNSVKGDDKKLEKLYKYYYDKMMDINKKLRDVQSQNIKSESQEKNWIEWTEVKKILNDLEDEVKKFGKDITPLQYMKVLKMIILSLYVLQAPRRNQDYQFMHVVKNKVPSDDINFLVFDKKQFWFRKYKTAKKELKRNDTDEIKIDISDLLFDNIKLYFKFHPLIKNKITAKMNVPFLVDFKGDELKNVNSITYILNSIFKKKIGSSMLRHLFLSSQYGDQLDKLKELEKVSKEMGHSTGMQKEYIKI